MPAPTPLSTRNTYKCGPLLDMSEKSEGTNEDNSKAE